MIILAIDALDLNLVKKFECTSLMQKECGKTDISGFNAERTVVLWASFLTGRNIEQQIPLKGQWDFKLTPEKTFLTFFDTYTALDVPAYSLDEAHAEERKLLKAFFEDKATVEEYDDVVWKNHENNKRKFLSSLGKFDLVMGYFNLADAIGHLSFGIPSKMEKVYQELEDLALKALNSAFTLVISDHGMKAVGRYGDHTKNGFYSTNKKLHLTLPKITDFYDIIRRVATNESS